MAPRVLYAGPAEAAETWRDSVLAAARADGVAIDLTLDPSAAAPETFDYVIYAPSASTPSLLPYTNLKAVISLWAGVETLVDRDDLPENAPLLRMVEPGLTIGMTDYVVAHAMRRHVDVDGAIERSRARRWDDVHPPLSTDRVIGVMGLGELGGDAAEKLATLRFDVRGWSRTPRTIPGVRSFAGFEALPEFLREIEILIVLLPLTDATRGLLNDDNLALLPKNAYIINAARGPIIDEGALLRSLDDHLGGATLDVFDIEPLPKDHPFWGHPKVTVTPHVASVTRTETASKAVVTQIARMERGEPPLHRVDRRRGY